MGTLDVEYSSVDRLLIGKCPGDCPSRLSCVPGVGPSVEMRGRSVSVAVGRGSRDGRDRSKFV